jgi:RimJ/RimL family protein N-acetyltransferase
MNSSAAARTYPITVPDRDGPVDIRYMIAADRDGVLAFARQLPTHDLLFLPRDISHPKVLDAWIREIERGALTTLLAVREPAVLGCATIVRDPLSWSPHVAELRAVLLPAARGTGLGRRLVEEAFRLAVSLGIEKIVAQMTADQTGAITVFETMGYRAEALLRDHVRDAAGEKHDIVILSHDVGKFSSLMSAYGLDGVGSEE